MQKIKIQKMNDLTDQLQIDLLEYLDRFPNEEINIEKCLKLLKSYQEGCNVFDRKCFSDGHFTTSAIVLNPMKNKILLTHHKFLQEWFQLGGHFEDDASLIESAIRETKEESGINEIISITNKIFDIDIHKIPENKNKNEPEHFHYDLRYLLKVHTEEFTISDESNELQWIIFKDLKTSFRKDMARMIGKLNNFI
jgi:8-oxo-dGTP pyrophosphatase MutT (NUDIX family)